MKVAAPTPATADDRSVASGGTARFALGLVARFFLTLVTVLLLWATVPLVLGWSPDVALTGSMVPAVIPGDVVLTAPVDPSSLRAGQVLSYIDPADGSRTMLHRLVRREPDGTLVTKGDANPTADSATIPPSAVRGLARLRVPYIGLPAVWRSRHDGGRLVALGVALGAAVWLAWRDGPLGRPRRLARHGRGPTSRPRWLARITAVAFVLVAATIGGGLGYPGTGVLSAFSAVSGTRGNAWAAGQVAAPENLAATVRCPGVVEATASGDASLARPSHVAPGDTLLAFVQFWADSSAAPEVTAPTGWTKVKATVGTAGDGNTFGGFVYRHRAGDNEPENYQWQVGPGARSASMLVDFRGAGTLTPASDAVQVADTFRQPEDGIDAPAPSSTTADSTQLVFIGVAGAPNPAHPEFYKPKPEGPWSNLGAAASQTAVAAFARPVGSAGSARFTFGKEAAADVFSLALAGSPSAELTWTPTTMARASGYDLGRDPGLPTQPVTVTPRAASSYVDSPLVSGTSYTWSLSAYARGWDSVPATTSVTPEC